MGKYAKEISLAKEEIERLDDAIEAQEVARLVCNDIISNLRDKRKLLKEAIRHLVCIRAEY